MYLYFPIERGIRRSTVVTKWDLIPKLEFLIYKLQFRLFTFLYFHSITYL